MPLRQNLEVSLPTTLANIVNIYEVTCYLKQGKVKTPLPEVYKCFIPIFVMKPQILKI